LTVQAKVAASGLQADVRRISGALGAEVRGVDLRKLDDAGFAQVNALLIEHQVIFFPGQRLSADEHRDFAMRFGAPEIHPFIPKLDEAHPEIVVLSAEEGYVADVWHTDVTFDASPPICSVLQMLKTPRAGGDTMWANQQLAYERLSEPMKAFLSGLTAMHSAANYGHPERQAEHPVVRRHPVTGKPSLFVNEQFTRRIPQLSREESKALLTHLYAHCTQPGFTCRYAWEEGTIAIWDNRCTQHYAVNDYEGERRISRVTILGDLPEPAFDTRRWPIYQAPRKSAASAGRDRD
jgi:taurine dioxygenase